MKILPVLSLKNFLCSVSHLNLYSALYNRDVLKHLYSDFDSMMQTEFISSVKQL